MKDFIKKWVQESKCCKRNKLECIPYQGLLRPLPVLERAWQDITVDSKALPISEGKDTMLVVVDKLTKYVILLPYHTPSQRLMLNYFL